MQQMNKQGEQIQPIFNLSTALEHGSTSLGIAPSFNSTIPVYSTNSSTPGKFGFPASSFTAVDMVSPELWNNIITGKDVNLNILLIPNYEHSTMKKNKESDVRLQRNLSMDEFVIAFGRYKRIKAKCAVMLIQHNIKIDWSKGDSDLGNMVCAGSKINTCRKCHSTTHSTVMCSVQQQNFQPQRNSNSSRNTPDSLGRDVIFVDGLPVCNNFNGFKGCTKPYSSSPINCDQLEFELGNHPDRNFVSLLCNSVRYGFDMLVSDINISTHECKNALSARKDPDSVTALIQDELVKGFIQGPFLHPPFSVYRVSPIGIAVHKYSVKKRLILDLSWPHNSCDHDSVNDLIDKDLCSLIYIKVDDAINAIQDYGANSICCKVDVCDAFKQLGILPSQ
ncbi:Hypothetical predicted protein [Mytilus galloprovincialis]|uniref:Uncharacterized protein n=1 Tax=Mytilus galloprovincialis TaxID=29158 RepID=A0A8B6GCY3_MYTGA|nr:Hypothetical predicted protein [Mytilus galloprovincialis]